MCVIIEKPKNVVISEEHLKKAWDKNRDGAGFITSNGKYIQMIKGFMTFDSFMNAINKTKAAQKELYSIFHFRISTGGKVDNENTHPYSINKENLLSYYGRVGTEKFLFHNGIFSIDADRQKSDTWKLSDILRHVRGTYQQRQIIDIIRNGSRVIITDGNPNPLIKLGEWTQKEGLFMSNTNHLTVTSTAKKYDDFTWYENEWSRYNKKAFSGLKTAKTSSKSAKSTSTKPKTPIKTRTLEKKEEKKKDIWGDLFILESMQIATSGHQQYNTIYETISENLDMLQETPEKYIMSILETLDDSTTFRDEEDKIRRLDTIISDAIAALKAKEELKNDNISKVFNRKHSGQHLPAAAAVQKR